MIESKVSIPSSETSFLFRVSRGDGPTSYLLGTFHTHQAIRNWSDASLLLSDLDTFVAETDFTAESNRRFLELATDHEQDLRARLGEKRLEDSLGLFAEYGIDALSTRFATWLLFLTMADAPRPSTHLDAHLSRLAKSSGLRLVGLQSAEQMVSSIRTIEDSVQTEILQETLCNHAAVREQARRLENFYSRDEVANFLEESERLRSPIPNLNKQLREALVDRRNDGFIKSLKPVFNRERAFVAVGAAHLFGDRGLVAQLRSEGYLVEPVDRKDLLEERLRALRTKLISPLPKLRAWLETQISVPKTYELPAFQLVISEEDVGWRNHTLFLSARHWSDLQTEDPGLMAILLAHLIHDVQKQSAPTENSCAFWNAQTVQNKIVQTRYLASRGAPMIGHELLANEDCIP